ncbi:diacylglycerol/lipid kinase family protein [Schleiferilactobacillus perolens]|jgi:YegS/Rv2252/BmrU family lipid kinase|uniref:diacylglycerol/lipid kinase family protein n=1 Tax=Schleiferilactobacillus perolens TaxID=100468 RepID=UPI002353701C|nr:YegS/Rv2252/BmrU family lipid kinase [Schleiferilactobacillus perolens]MCI2170151.1 YegS/Rv2252/BmrU family lipid kinase [Schleiferilactobacillus perolens]
MENITLIINPQAGNSRHRKQIPALVAQLTRLFHIDQTYYTAQDGDARRIARGLAPSVNGRCIVIGGDGTLHDTVNGLQESQNQTVAVGYIPTGTGNDYARAHGIPLQPNRAIAALRHSRPIVTKIGKAVSPEIGTQYFINNFGIGIDARIVYDTNHSETKTGLNRLHLGQFAYLTNILRALKNQHGFPATWQAEQTHFNDRTYLFVFTNHPFLGGGIRLFPDDQRDPDRLSLVMVNKAKWHVLVPILMNILSGQSNHPRLHVYRRHHFRFATTAQEHIQIDGEEFHAPIHVVLSQTNQLMWLPGTE